MVSNHIHPPSYTFTPIINKYKQIGMSKDHFFNGCAQVDRIYGVLGGSGVETSAMMKMMIVMVMVIVMVAMMMMLMTTS